MIPASIPESVRSRFRGRSWIGPSPPGEQRRSGALLGPRHGAAPHRAPEPPPRGRRAALGRVVGALGRRRPDLPRPRPARGCGLCVLGLGLGALVAGGRCDDSWRVALERGCRLKSEQRRGVSPESPSWRSLGGAPGSGPRPREEAPCEILGIRGWMLYRLDPHPRPRSIVLIVSLPLAPRSLHHILLGLIAHVSVAPWPYAVPLPRFSLWHCSPPLCALCVAASAAHSFLCLSSALSTHPRRRRVGDLLGLACSRLHATRTESSTVQNFSRDLATQVSTNSSSSAQEIPELGQFW